MKYDQNKVYVYFFLFKSMFMTISVNVVYDNITLEIELKTLIFLLVKDRH